VAVTVRAADAARFAVVAAATAAVHLEAGRVAPQAAQQAAMRAALESRRDGLGASVLAQVTQIGEPAIALNFGAQEPVKRLAGHRSIGGRLVGATSRTEKV
jgi:hypothetical protein